MVPHPPRRVMRQEAARPRDGPSLDDSPQLEVHDLEVQVLTGIYSEETHLPQPLRISLTVDIDLPGAVRSRHAAVGVEELSRPEARRDDRVAARACISR